MVTKALRINLDGTVQDLELPPACEAGHSLPFLDALRRTLGGEIEITHHRRLAGGGLTVVVHEYSALDMAPNWAASQAVEAALGTGRLLPYWLHGPVVVLGWDGGENETLLPDELHGSLLLAAAHWRAREQQRTDHAKGGA